LCYQRPFKKGSYVANATDHPLIYTFVTSTACSGNESEKPGVEKSSSNEEDQTDAKDKNAADKAAKDDDFNTKEKPPKIGNFSLPSSQQLAALFGFGGNIIDNNQVQLYFFADEFYGKKNSPSI